VQEENGLYREAAASYSHAWDLVGDAQLPADCESLLIDAIASLPRALLIAQSALECGRCIRELATNPPANVPARLLPSLRRRLGSLLLRSVTSLNYITAPIVGTRYIISTPPPLILLAHNSDISTVCLFDVIIVRHIPQIVG
jgi:hypothetical protein